MHFKFDLKPDACRIKYIVPNRNSLFDLLTPFYPLECHISVFETIVHVYFLGPAGLPNAEEAVKNVEDFVVGCSNLPGWDHDSLLKLYAKLFVNTFSLYDEESRTVIGDALFVR